MLTEVVREAYKAQQAGSAGRSWGRVLSQQCCSSMVKSVVCVAVHGSCSLMIARQRLIALARLCETVCSPGIFSC